MEAVAATWNLTRSVSLPARLCRSRTARFPSLQLCPLSASAAASPRARSDADLASFARSGAVVRHSPIRAILDADEEDQEKAPGGLDRLLKGAGAGKNGGGCDMREYYRRVLRVDPENPLLLRNYGKYMHEVEGDLAGAEGCYARALLACPGDAELLSLYGRVIWEAHQEKDRAAAYLERAVQAAPDDCYVLGSYASFLWDAEEEEEQVADVQKEETTASTVAVVVASPALVPAC
ncbi:uncharacterized protein LOC133906906 [Phragmites australis]|uniref:uncharacterized protein LOC133906906 n=1 Tax=Phragmites australis TaxID=29695 RepID=UPI002D769CA9|nr:uncharacterized protein LOC133906906 [Phragmites australis]